MDSYRAVAIAEGFEEAENQTEYLDAWQFLHDSGLAYSLQGWFGRTAKQLLDEGYIVDNRIRSE